MMWYQKRGSKYGAKSTEYEGQVYHSKKEAGRARELDLLLKAKEIKGWKRQVRIPLDINNFHICNYYIDFEVEHNDGTIEWEEVKGFETEIWRLKRKLVEAIYDSRLRSGELKYTVIK